MAAVIPFETSDLSAGEQLGKRIARLKACLNAAQAEFLELLCEFDEQRYWEDLGFTSCAHWLNFRCGIGINAARERLRMAHALVELPKIRAGFAEGSLSFSKVRAMTRVATPENEDLLLNIAHHGAAYHVEHWCNGGETRLDNLVLLCRYHHRLVHEGGFDCRRTKSGEIYFVDLRQRRIREYERAKPVSIDATLAWMYRRFDEHQIDSDTCAAGWHAGTDIDWGHAMIMAFTQRARCQRPLHPEGNHPNSFG